MNTHKVRIRLSPASRGEVWIDDHEVPHVARVQVEAAVREATRVIIELVAVELDIELEGAELETRNES